MLHLQTKAPGDELASRPVDLEVSFDEVFGERQEAYQRLLEDAMVGDARRFGRADALDEQWRIFEQALAAPHPVSLYHRGTWGPSAAEALSPRPVGGTSRSRSPEARTHPGDAVSQRLPSLLRSQLSTRAPEVSTMTRITMISAELLSSVSTSGTLRSKVVTVGRGNEIVTLGTVLGALKT